MTTDEAIRKATALLWNYHEFTGKSSFRIRGDVLKDEGLDSSTFWTYVCPKLVKDGVLAEWPRLDVENVPTLNHPTIKMYKTLRAYTFSVNKNRLLEAINRKTHLHIEDSKIELAIDREKGISLSDKSVSYPISGKRFDIIKKLLELDVVSISELEELTGWDKSDVSRSISKINSTFMVNLRVEDKLIDRLGTGGYTLNRKTFSINSNI